MVHRDRMHSLMSVVKSSICEFVILVVNKRKMWNLRTAYRKNVGFETMAVYLTKKMLSKMNQVKYPCGSPVKIETSNRDDPWPSLINESK